ncbi:MAG: dihydrodipicolinate synthase family protein [Spirochaetes bacterium]|nr:dihydrodipicolinate synthase family protein [Spirochaetota bacterium]
MKKEYFGCWPTMITPFTADNKVDFKAVKAMVEWYVRRGADGIFAVCQSSEMFFLSGQEKLDIARSVLEAAAGRIKVIASGHTADDPAKQIEELGKMAETGVDAVVLVSNRFAAAYEGEDVFTAKAENVFRQLPNVTFGLYECPYPYRRLLTDEFLVDCARKGRLVFLKDVSCSNAILARRARLVKGTSLSLFNANTSTVLDSFIAGYDGYNGVMANFHVDIYKWLYLHFAEDPVRARKVSDFLTVAAIVEARTYPTCAKYHMNATGIPMTLTTRSKNAADFNENAVHEVESIIRMEKAMRAELGLPL